jgi:predicted transcriptional regulator of viral defense system
MQEKVAMQRVGQQQVHGQKEKKGQIDSKWKIIINMQIESDL